MKIRIGAVELGAARPPDLAEQVAASSGLSLAEVAAQLGGEPSASSVARALRPFLGDGAPSVPALATAIAGAGTASVAWRVRKLFVARPRRTGKDEHDNGQ